MESNGEKENITEALKRRSSILKTRDETKITNTNFTRRISFHNVLKVQQYNKDNGDLCKEQEEQLHMTSNSDNFRTEIFSTSFVAGPSVNNMYDPSLTFLNSPQANSTPAVSASYRSRKAKSTTAPEDTMANMTMNVFNNIKANRPIEIFGETVNMSDKTYVAFEPLKARSTEENTQVMGTAVHMEDETQNIFDLLKARPSRLLTAMNEDDDGETKALFARLEANKILNESKIHEPNLLKENEGFIEPMDHESVVDEQQSHANNQNHAIDPQLSVIVNQSYNSESQLCINEQKDDERPLHVSEQHLTLGGNQLHADEQLGPVFHQQFEDESPITVKVIEESRWSNRFYNSGGTSISLSRSMSGFPTPQSQNVKSSKDAPSDGSMFTGVTEDMMAQAALRDENNFNFGESMLAPVTPVTDPLMRSRFLRLISDTRITALNDSALQEPSEMNDISFQHAAAANSHHPSNNNDAEKRSFDVFADMEATSDKNNTIPFDEFDKNATYSVNNGLAFENNNTFSLEGATSEKNSTNLISLPSPKKTFHKRRRSLVFVSAANNNSAATSPNTQFVVKPSSIPIGIIERRRSLLKKESDMFGSAVASPTIVVATEDSFNDIVIEVNDSEMAFASELHSRKQAIYKLMETILDHMEGLKVEKTRFDAELKSSFAELLMKIDD